MMLGSRKAAGNSVPKGGGNDVLVDLRVVVYQRVHRCKGGAGWRRIALSCAVAVGESSVDVERFEVSDRRLSETAGHRSDVYRSLQEDTLLDSARASDCRPASLRDGACRTRDTATREREEELHGMTAARGEAARGFRRIDDDPSVRAPNLPARRHRSVSRPTVRYA